MNGSDTLQVLPPYKKLSAGPSPIAPFKLSVKRNPNYFSVARSPDFLVEKQRLKEENWKLKQMMHSLNEENLKLKQKLFNHLESNRLVLNEGFQINQNRHLDALQESLRTLKNDLKKKSQEISELKKRLNSSREQQKDMKKIKYSKTSLNLFDDPELLNKKIREQHDQDLEELNSRIFDLQNQLKSLNNYNFSLLSDCDSLKATISRLEGHLTTRKDLKISSEYSLSIIVPKDYLKPPMHGMNASNSFSSQSELHRELLKSDQANLFRFFRSFFNEAQRVKISPVMVIELLNSSKKQDPNEIFQEFLSDKRIKLPQSEIKAAFKALNTSNKLTKSEFLSVVESHAQELDSEKSSDISSVSSSNYHQHLNKDQTLFENVSLTLRETKLTKGNLEEITLKKLPECVTLQRLTAFFFESCDFITSTSDKTYIALSFMNGCEVIRREDVLEKMKDNFFLFDDFHDSEIYDAVKVVNRIKSKEIEIMKKFIELDAMKSGSVSWDNVLGVLKQFEIIQDEEVRGFKVHCFYLAHSLKTIPFEKLL